VIPRSQRMYSQIDVNALGFIGSLLVRVTDDVIPVIDPMAVLCGVSYGCT